MTIPSPEPDDSAQRRLFEALFRQHFAGMWRFAAHYVDEEAAADIAQEVFLKAWEKRDLLDAERSIRAYLYRAVRNGALNYLKHRRMRARVEEPLGAHVNEPFETVVEETVEYEEFRSAVHQAVQRLPERRRLVYELARQHGCSYDEIAEILGINRKSVVVQMGRALADLRRMLTPFMEHSKGAV